MTVSINVAALTISQKFLTSAFNGCARPQQDSPLYLDMYKRGLLKVDDLITKTYAIQATNEAISDLHAGVNGLFLF